MMCNTASKLPDRLEFLRMAQRFLGAGALGAFGDQLPVLLGQFARALRDSFLEQPTDEAAGKVLSKPISEANLVAEVRSALAS